MRDKRYFKPIMAALAVYTLWGFSFMASKLAQISATPMVVLMYRFDIATVCMLMPWLFGKKKVVLKGKNIKGLLLLGTCEPVIYFIGEQYGLKYTNSAFSGVMIAVIPVVTLIMAAVFLKEYPSKPQWVFSILSIAGVVAITLISGGSGNISAAGVALLVLAVVSGSGYAVVSRAISDEFSVYERSLVMQLMGAVFYTFCALAESRSDLTAIINPVMDSNFVFGILYLSLGASVAGYSLYNYAVCNAPIANVASFCNLTTVLSVLAGVVFLNEPFSAGSAAALVVVLVGIWGVQKYTPEKEEKTVNGEIQ